MEVGFRCPVSEGDILVSRFWKPGGLNFRHPGDQRHLTFLKDADLIIHDAQYTDSEYPSKLGWGHSTIEYATDAERIVAFAEEDAARAVALQRLVLG